MPKHGQTSTTSHWLHKMSDLSRLIEALRELAPFELVTGDTIKRTNPHSAVNLNSTETWVVSSGNRSAHRSRAAIATIHEIINKGVTT